MDKNPDEVYVFLMERVLRHVKQRTKTAFEAEDIELSIDQWVILKRIREIVHPTQIQLAKSTFKNPASVTRILDTLENKDYIKRFVIENDRRTNLIELTAKGYDAFDKIMPIAESVRAQGLEALSAKEHDQLVQLLQKVVKSLD